MTTTPPRVFAIVVCYNPPAGLGQRLQRIAAEVDQVLVWDNGSQADCRPQTMPEHVEWLAHERNIGIAAAQNRALSRALQAGASHAVLFDHDSLPQPGMVAQLLQAMHEAESADAPVAVCVPRILYALDEIECRWPQQRGLGFRLRYARDMSSPEAVDLAISSGMLLDLASWRKLGGFDESLFIDLVDTEYCLHARAQGYRILACPQAQLRHALGEVQQRRLAGLKLYPTHHSAWRHYMINRNRLILCRRYALIFPGWLAYEWLGACKLALKALLFEPGRLGKLAAMLRGNVAGLWRVLRGARAVRAVHHG